MTKLEKLSYLISDYSTGKGTWLIQRDTIASYHERIPVQEARRTFREHYGEEINTNKINDTMQRFAEEHYHVISDFEIERNLIHFANCVYIIDKGIAIAREFGSPGKQLYEIADSDVKYSAIDFSLDDYNVKTLYISKHEYHPDARVPVEFIEYVERVLNNDEEKIAQLYEFCGYCLTNIVRFKKAAMFFGDTNTGKSTLAKIILNVVDNYAMEKISDITKKKNFNRASLYHKKVNYDDEGGSSSIKNADYFKQLTGWEEINIERKGVQPFAALHTCKILVSANRLGEVESLDEIFANRWLIFEFYNMFSQEEIAQDNGKFLTRMKKQENVEGLIRLFITHLRELLKRGRFEHEETNLEFWRMHSDIVYRFVKEFCEKSNDPNFCDECSVVYEEFVAYAETQPENPITSQNMFTRRLKAIGVRQLDAHVAGKHVKCYNLIVH